jgi:hypothetical protein
MLTDVDVDHRLRQMAAAVLAELRPELSEPALAELRTQAGDECLEFTWRTEAVVQLAKLEPTTRDEAVTYHRAVLDDARQPVSDRCEAAYQLVKLDDSCTGVALAALRRFVTAPSFTVEEHADVVGWLAGMYHFGTPEVIPFALVVARDPAASAWARRRVGNRLPGRARVEVERSLLSDRTALPNQRVGNLTTWEYGPLGDEAEAVLRDVLTAVETTPAERVEAAAALGKLGPGHVPEAVRLLKEMSGGWGAATARTELAELSLSERRRMVAEAEAAVADETSPWRTRYEAAALVVHLGSNPPDHVVEYLRQLTRDPRLADRQRLEIHRLLRFADGLDPIRTMRDEHTRPEIRWMAARRLINHDVADRAAGARVLNAIATDTACRPALRWRTARDLGRFGERGRELAATALLALAGDESVPVIARVDAATTLGNIRPDLRVEIMRLLRGLQDREEPRQRLQVLQAIGGFDPTEGTVLLTEMTASALPPGVRLRAADAMAGMRRDYRERAAITARDIAHDTQVSHHIRVKAARNLARWSDLCRAEAQALLTELAASGSGQ